MFLLRREDLLGVSGKEKGQQMRMKLLATIVAMGALSGVFASEAHAGDRGRWRGHHGGHGGWGGGISFSAGVRVGGGWGGGHYYGGHRWAGGGWNNCGPVVAAVPLVPYYREPEYRPATVVITTTTPIYVDQHGRPIGGGVTYVYAK